MRTKSLSVKTVKTMPVMLGETEGTSDGSSEDGDGETETSDEKGKGEEDGNTDNDALVVTLVLMPKMMQNR